jgi:hypothetical protein
MILRNGVLSRTDSGALRDPETGGETTGRVGGPPFSLPPLDYRLSRSHTFG